MNSLTSVAIAASAARLVAAVGIAGLSVLPAQQGALDRLAKRAEALGVRTGVLVRDVQSDSTLYSRRAGEVFIPASNMKVLSAAATLGGLGREYQFTTGFRLRGGWLEIEAGGDPNWIQDGHHDPERIFAGVAEALRERGVARIRGVRLLQGPYTGPGRPSGWPRNQIDQYYCAPTGGLVLEEGCFKVRVKPGPGRATVEVLAPPVRRWPQSGRIELTSSQKRVWGVRDSGGRLQLFGKLYRQARASTVKLAVADPAPWFEAAARDCLVRAGILVAANAPARDVDLPPYRSALLPALQRSLEESSNFTAEQCLRVLGAERIGDGSLAGGVARMRKELEALVGNLPSNVRLVDGSGLSRGNEISPTLVVAVLRAVLRSKLAGAYSSCMAVPGGAGSLKSRFVGSPVRHRVRAKTGWIRGASALSGFLQTTDRRIRVFSILMNYDPSISGRNKTLKALQEDMVEAMDAIDG